MINELVIDLSSIFFIISNSYWSPAAARVWLSSRIRNFRESGQIYDKDNFYGSPVDQASYPVPDIMYASFGMDS